jgi:transcriptional regulator with XRE-family HTH domain
MDTVDQKILEIRKSKGLTQEQLSEAAGINLRTLQRIEKNQTEPLGNTLRNICKVLGIEIEDILDYNQTEDNSILILLHLSVLSFLILPLSNIILPLILWITKREKIINLNDQAIDLINFQILWSFLFYTSIIAFPILNINHRIERWGPFYIAIALLLINIIYPIFISIKIKRKGIHKFYYPIFQFIKK